MRIVSGKIRNVKAPDWTNKYGVQYQDIELELEDGDRFWGRIGKKTPYTEDDIGRKDQWEISQDHQTKQYNLKSYYPPRGESQPRQQRAQTTQEPKMSKVEWEAKEARKQRAVTLGYAIKLHVAATEAAKDAAPVTKENCTELAEYFFDYVWFGPTDANDKSLKDRVKAAWGSLSENFGKVAEEARKEIADEFDKRLEESKQPQPAPTGDDIPF